MISYVWFLHFLMQISKQRIARDLQPSAVELIADIQVDNLYSSWFLWGSIFWGISFFRRKNTILPHVKKAKVRLVKESGSEEEGDKNLSLDSDDRIVV